MEDKRLLQIGVIVKSRDEAVKWYEDILGLGPFTLRELNLESCEYYGEKHGQCLKLALCQFGPVILELIEVVGGKSVHKDFYERCGEGIDHIALQVNDLTKALEEFSEKGLKMIEGDRKKGFAYVDFDRVGGVKLELIQMKPGASLL